MTTAVRGRRQPRRAWACLAWAFACFLVAQAAFLLAKETARPELRDPEYAHKLRRLRARTHENPGRPLVLVLGSSRIGFGLRTDIMDANRPGAGPIVFNFGMCQCTPVLQRLMLQRLLDDGVRPSYLVVEWYPPFMPAGATQADEFMNPVRLNWPDLQTLERFSGQPESLRNRWLGLQAGALYAHRHTVLNRYAVSWVPRPERFDDRWAGMGPWGWTPNPHLAGPMEPKVFADYVRRREAEIRSLFADWSPSLESDRALRETLALCQTADVPAALFWAPEPSWMRRWYTPEAIDRIDRYVAALGQVYQAQMIVGRDWVPDDLFLEEMHPLYAGAELCSRRFEREALPRLAAGSPGSDGRGNLP